jgi:hypothetical protein
VNFHLQMEQLNCEMIILVQHKNDNECFKSLPAIFQKYLEHNEMYFTLHNKIYSVISNCIMIPLCKDPGK